eukprot:955780-Prymnesium_polylepis.1
MAQTTQQRSPRRSRRAQSRAVTRSVKLRSGELFCNEADCPGLWVRVELRTRTEVRTVNGTHVRTYSAHRAHGFRV